MPDRASDDERELGLERIAAIRRERQLDRLCVSCADRDHQRCTKGDCRCSTCRPGLTGDPE